MLESFVRLTDAHVSVMGYRRHRRGVRYWKLVGVDFWEMWEIQGGKANWGNKIDWSWPWNLFSRHNFTRNKFQQMHIPPPNHGSSNGSYSDASSSHSGFLKNILQKIGAGTTPGPVAKTRGCDKHTLPFFTIIELWSDWCPPRLKNVGFSCHVPSSFTAEDARQALILQYAKAAGVSGCSGVS